MDISFFQKINNTYKSKSKQETELWLINRNEERYLYDNVDYQPCTKNDEDYGMLIIKGTNDYTKKIKALQSDPFNLGDYIRWKNQVWIVTSIDTDDKVDGKQSVRAETSQMAGILAAGNLFTGQFAGLVGTSGGKVNFGRPWTVRPKALKLYCKYTTGPMDIIGKSTPPGVNLIKGETYDRADIKVALGYWEARTYGGSKDSPVHIDTTDPSTFVDFNTDKCTIGNGNVTIYYDGYALNGGQKVSDQTDKWIEYTIPINYRDMETLPSHIIISCAASQYGDYFSGCSTSKLWIDKVELVY